MPTTNENAADDIIGHRLALLRYESGTVTRLLSVYDAALKDVVVELEKARKKLAAGLEIDDRQRKRLTALSAELRAGIRELNRIATLTLSERLADAAAAEQAFLAGTLSRTIGVALRGIPEDRVALMLTDPIGGSVWRDRLAVDLVATETGLQGALSQALARGLSIPRAAAVIKGLGIAETYRGRLVSIARTEIQRVANQVAMETYATNADVIKGVQVLATLDTRTCPICGALHNTVYPIVGGRLQGLERLPPFHTRCRCAICPVTKSYSELGLTQQPANRSILDGNPAQDQTFEQWLRKKPASYADEVFGPTRAAAWRAGKLPLSGMVSGMRVLNLGELSARYPDALPV